jgi:hypothetical protein
MFQLPGHGSSNKAGLRLVHFRLSQLNFDLAKLIAINNTIHKVVWFALNRPSLRLVEPNLYSAVHFGTARQKIHLNASFHFTHSLI